MIKVEFNFRNEKLILDEYGHIHDKDGSFHKSQAVGDLYFAVVEANYKLQDLIFKRTLKLKGI